MFIGGEGSVLLRIVSPGDFHDLAVLDNKLGIALIKTVVFGFGDSLGDSLDARDGQRLTTCFDGGEVKVPLVGEGHVFGQIKAYCSPFGIGAEVIVAGGGPAVGVLGVGQGVAVLGLEAAIDVNVTKFVLLDGLNGDGLPRRYRPRPFWRRPRCHRDPQ